MILSVMAYLKKDVLWRNDISFKKDTEKVVLLLVKKGLIQIIVKFKGENSLITFLSCPKRTFEGKWCEKWCMKYCARKMMEFIWKWKAYFRNTIGFMISEKSIKTCMSFHRGVQVCTENLNKAYNEIVHQNFKYFQPLNNRHVN